MLEFFNKNKSKDGINGFPPMNADMLNLKSKILNLVQQRKDAWEQKKRNLKRLEERDELLYFEDAIDRDGRSRGQEAEIQDR
jgi:hypothetical protein